MPSETENNNDYQKSFLTEKQKKVKQKLEESLNNLYKIAQTIDLQKGNKVSTDEASNLIQEYFAEDIEAKKIEFKKAFGEILKKKKDFNNHIEEAARKFNENITKKEVEFTKEINSLFNLIDGISDLKNVTLDSIINTPSLNNEEVEDRSNGTGTTDES